jgi:L-histidine N-alpha-methyltransferase
MKHDGHDGSSPSPVRAGLAARPPELPPKYFYDARGSRLFEEITRLPEYYLTRAERAILAGWAPRRVPELGVRTFVELGPGSAEKARLLLDAMDARATYVPIDVSAAALETTARELRRSHPGLRVEPVAADFTAELALPRDLPRPALFAFLGSTIGNFTPPRAVALLRRMAAAMGPRDRFLLGADLKKDRARLEAAYNDARGVTAEFNRNMLRVLNRELGADFDPDGFAHRAVYDDAEGRIEMYLVATRDQTVTIPEIGTYRFRPGDAIRTEVSYKYDRRTVETLLEEAGYALEEWTTDPEQEFALALARRR